MSDLFPGGPDRTGFPAYGDRDCPHTKPDRKDLGYALICKRCGAVRAQGEWIRRLT